MMRTLVIAIALLGASAGLLTEATAQTRLSRGQAVRGTLSQTTSADGERTYSQEFVYQAKAGELPIVYVHAGYRGDWSVELTEGTRVFTSRTHSCGGAAPTGSAFEVCRYERTLRANGTVRITLRGERAGDFVVAVYGSREEELRRADDLATLIEPNRRGVRSSGIQISAGYGAVTFSPTMGGTAAATEKGVGPTLRLAYEMGGVAMFAEGQMSEMAPEGEGYDEFDEYTLYHVDIGTRVYLLGERGVVRPYAQLTAGMRRLAGESPAGDQFEAQGFTLTPGAGAQIVFTRNLAIEGSYRRSAGEIDEARLAGEDWMDIPEESLISGPTSRINVEMVLRF